MTMTTTQLEQQILDHLREQYAAPPESTPETTFEALEYDSLVVVELSLSLGKMYAVELEDAEIKEAGSAAGLAALLLAKGVTGVTG
ncbi:hypothetical protein SRB5_14270 [Streptomyces sp. RB5]|uniref:Carrier domain-containing protein n=1 Tax=Streptomyces smaragdinus TaxID=2585196 RepID=A0A7K0CE17_9ACTN|nr:acyl carrier protein [Streptomyces smaragdinus]MQY11312.1 hypothetical protein [Streptomyces smaragdinus]